MKQLEKAIRLALVVKELGVVSEPMFYKKLLSSAFFSTLIQDRCQQFVLWPVDAGNARKLRPLGNVERTETCLP